MGDPALLYPSLDFADIERRELLLTDPERVGQQDRPIPVAVRWSPSATQPMPVVVLSHGGAFGHVNPRGALDEWAELVARHGYFGLVNQRHA